MCGRWVPWVGGLLPFMLTFAYAYWWSNLRQRDARTDGSAVGLLIFFGTMIGGLIVATRLCP